MSRILGTTMAAYWRRGSLGVGQVADAAVRVADHERRQTAIRGGWPARSSCKARRMEEQPHGAQADRAEGDRQVRLVQVAFDVVAIPGLGKTGVDPRAARALMPGSF